MFYFILWFFSFFPWYIGRPILLEIPRYPKIGRPLWTFPYSALTSTSLFLKPRYWFLINIVKSLLGQWTFTETSYGKDVISIFSSGMSLIPWTSPQEQHYKTTLYRLRVSRDDEIQSNIPLYFKGKIISLPY